MNLPTDKRHRAKGVIVKAVQKGSPADNADIRKGDIILEIEGKTLYTIDDYQLAMRGVSAGNSITSTVLRDSGEMNVVVKTSTFPDSLAKELATQLFGIEVDDISSQNRKKYRSVLYFGWFKAF